MRDIQDLFRALKGSAFRRRFSLGPADREYLMSRGLPTIVRHADDFIAKRLAPAEPHRDGKQTPWKGHPVFVAQHATATCCRGCLQKWHFIEKGRELTVDERDYVVNVIARWLRIQMVQRGTNSVEGIRTSTGSSKQS
jgi:hypothetical protein